MFHGQNESRFQQLIAAAVQQGGLVGGAPDDGAAGVAGAAGEKAADNSKAADGAAGDKKVADDGGVLGDVGKAEDKKAADDKAADKSADKSDDFKITLPQGTVVDEAVLAEFTKVAKDSGLNSEQASKLAKYELERMAAFSTAEENAWKEQHGKWEAELKADKTIGGEKFGETKVQIQKLLRQYGVDQSGKPDEGQSFAKEARELGIGNMPSLVRLLAKLAAANAEGRAHGQGGGGAPGGKPQTFSDLYNKPGRAV